MAVGTFFHYIGSAMLFVAVILTIVVNVSAPVVQSITFMNLDLDGSADAQFGVFGYCSTGRADGDSTCSKAHVGYDPAKVLEDVGNLDFSSARADTTEALTRVFILHPIGTVVLFIAFLLSLLAGSAVGSILATLVSGLSLVINAIAVIVDFVIFKLLKDEVEKSSGNNSGSYGAAIFVALVAAILALVATILMFVTCCAGRRRRNHESRKSMQY